MTPVPNTKTDLQQLVEQKHGNQAHDTIRPAYRVPPKLGGPNASNYWTVRSGAAWYVLCVRNLRRRFPYRHDRLDSPRGYPKLNRKGEAKGNRETKKGASGLKGKTGLARTSMPAVVVPWYRPALLTGGGWGRGNPKTKT